MPILFEVKETWGVAINDEMLCPNYPKDIKEYIDFYIGISYPRDYQEYMISPDRAYDRAKEAHYWIPDIENGRWESLGKWQDFIRYFSILTKLEHSLPMPYRESLSFNMWHKFQILPCRELIRRHIIGNASIQDIDIFVVLDD